MGIVRGPSGAGRRAPLEVSCTFGDSGRGHRAPHRLGGGDIGVAGTVGASGTVGRLGNARALNGLFNIIEGV